MAVPSRTARHVTTILRSVATHNVLDGPSQQVAIVRQTSRKWGSIKEMKTRKMFRQLQLLAKRVYTTPVLHNLFLH